MRWFLSARARLRLLLARRSAEARMQEEIRIHVEMETEENIRAGMEPGEARRRALIAFGGVERHKEAMRDGRGGRWLEELVQDLRFAVRSLVKTPGFTVVATLTIAVGIGATTVVFSLVNAVLLRPLPVPEAERLFAVAEARVGAFSQGIEGRHVPYARYVAYREAAEPMFSGLAAQRLASFAVQVRREATAVRGVLVSGNYFGVLGLHPEAGRFFTADDERAVVLGYGLWRDRFGSDTDVIGSVVYVDSEPFTAVGVAPSGFDGTTPGVTSDLWVPVAAARPDSWVAPFGRLRPGVRPSQGSAFVDVVANRIPPDEPQTRVFGAELESMNGVLRGGFRGVARTALTMLLGTAMIVLLIASGNITGMLMARGVMRHREVAIRQAMGAGRGRLVRQLLTENGLLVSIGGVVGVLLALVGRPVALAAPLPFAESLALDLSLDLRVLGFALALTMATALLFGLMPALQTSRFTLVPALKNGGSIGGTAAPRARNVFVAGQLALSVFLLALAALFIHSIQRTLAVDLGYDPEDVVIATTDLDPHGYEEDLGLAFYRRLTERVGAIPGVESVSLARSALAGGRIEGNDMEARSGADVRTQRGVTQNRVDPTFFATLRLPIVAGRGLTDQDRAGAPAVMVVNETLARRLWPDANPIGQRVSTYGGELDVVGVVRDGRYGFRDGSPTGYAFFPFDQRYAGRMTLHVRGPAEPAELIRRIREEVRAIDPNVAVEGAQPLSVPVRRLHAPQRAATSMLALFGGIGVVLAGIGVYGVLAFQVAQRRREFGVRLALGAPARVVVRQVVGRGTLLAAVGVVLGLVFGVGASFVLRGTLYGVTGLDPLPFAGVVAVLMAVALVASFVPVRRAMRVDPVEILKAD